MTEASSSGGQADTLDAPIFGDDCSEPSCGWAEATRRRKRSPSPACSAPPAAPATPATKVDDTARRRNPDALARKATRPGFVESDEDNDDDEVETQKAFSLSDMCLDEDTQLDTILIPETPTPERQRSSEDVAFPPHKVRRMASLIEIEEDSQGGAPLVVISEETQDLIQGLGARLAADDAAVPAADADARRRRQEQALASCDVGMPSQMTQGLATAAVNPNDFDFADEDKLFLSALPGEQDVLPVKPSQSVMVMPSQSVTATQGLTQMSQATPEEGASDEFTREFRRRLQYHRERKVQRRLDQ